MSQTKEKCDSLVLSRSELGIVWRCHGISRVCRYYFCLEPTVRKDAWMRTTSVTVMAFFSKVAFWKLLDHSYVQSSFPINTRHIENSILKEYPTVKYFPDIDQLTLNIFHQDFCKHEKKSKIVPRKRSVAQKSKGALRRTLNLSRPCFTYFIRFFLSQTWFLNFTYCWLAIFGYLWLYIYLPFCLLFNLWLQGYWSLSSASTLFHKDQ